MIGTVSRNLLASFTLEELLESPLGFNLTLSNVQRACCRIATGVALGALLDDPAVRRALGTANGIIARPKEFALVSGIRAGKSLFAAGLAVFASQTVDVSGLGPGNTPRVSVVSLTRDLAKVVFKHLVGRVQASPLLRTLVVGEPTADTITLRHPSGIPIEIVVSAGSRAGGSLVGRWLAAVIFDEYARMVDADGVVNHTEMRKAVLERVLPGGFIAHVSSPWAPFGPAYNHVTRFHGKPSQDLVVVHCAAWDLYPQYWTPERVEEARLRDAFDTDVAAKFAVAEESFIPPEYVKAALRLESSDMPYEPGYSYRASMDPATRGNSWTFIVYTRKGDKTDVACAREWTGSSKEPLSPKAVLEEMAILCSQYRVERVASDIWSIDALQDLARDAGIVLDQVKLTEKQKFEVWSKVRNGLEAGNIRFPNIEHIREDLVRLKKRITRTGVSIDLPHTSDGRHCDFSPAVMLMGYAPAPDWKPPQMRDPETIAMREAAKRKYGKQEGSWR